MLQIGRMRSLDIGCEVEEREQGKREGSESNRERDGEERGLKLIYLTTNKLNLFLKFLVVIAATRDI